MDQHLALKITDTCNHKPPVIISCHECMLASLAKWEKRLGDDYKNVVMDDIKQLEVALLKSRTDYVKLQEINDGLIRAISQEKRAVEALRQQIGVEKRLVADTNAQLTAEIAAHQKYPVIVEVDE